MNEANRRRLYPALLAAVGLLLIFPGLGSFGLWDPHEVKLADAARSLVQSPLGLPSWGKPPMLLWWIAGGFKLFGVGEWGGRLPVALGSLAALLAVYWAGAPLIGRRGALFGALALLTTPAFLLGARSLASNAPLVLGAALAVGGLSRAALPEEGSSLAGRLLAVVLGLAGLALGQLSGGVFVGVLAPLATVAIALALVGGATAIATVLAVAAVGALAVALWAWRHVTGYSTVLGGVPHALGHATTIASALPKLGFGLFPWIALVPPAAAAVLEPGPSGAPEARALRRRYGWLLLLTWAVVTYLLAMLQAGAVQEVLPPLGPALLLLGGAWLDELLDDPRPVPFAGLVVALGAIIIGKDLFNAPEHFISAHLLEAVRWPGPLTHVPYLIIAYALIWGGFAFLALGWPLANPSAPEAARLAGRRQLTLALLASAVVFSLGVDHWVIPQVSKHLSARDLYGKTRLLDPKAPLGQYRFNATGSSYYSAGKAPTTLQSSAELFQFLGRSERVFVMAGSEELPNIDQAARQSKTAYYVIDDSNSRYLVLSNRLGPKEQDLNPLKRFISEAAPKPQFPLDVDFEGKVRLIGYDLAPTIQHGADFKMRLYFQVVQPLGGNYKVFIHMDGAGTRINGDHVPLDGKFPTTNWVPGYYITDEYKMEARVQGLAAPSGVYNVFMGFFLGESRLKVTSGPQDGENRVKLGKVTVK